MRNAAAARSGRKRPPALDGAAGRASAHCKTSTGLPAQAEGGDSPPARVGAPEVCPR